MVTSPSFCCSRAISRSRASGVRFFSTAWLARINCLRHWESRAAVTPGSWESSSRSSPRQTRNMLSSYRRAGNRFPLLSATPGPSPVALRPPSAGSANLDVDPLRHLLGSFHFTQIGVQKIVDQNTTFLAKIKFFC